MGNNFSVTHPLPIYRFTDLSDRGLAFPLPPPLPFSEDVVTGWKLSCSSHCTVVIHPVYWQSPLSHYLSCHFVLTCRIIPKCRSRTSDRWWWRRLSRIQNPILSPLACQESKRKRESGVVIIISRLWHVVWEMEWKGAKRERESKSDQLPSPIWSGGAWREDDTRGKERDVNVNV